MSSNITDKKIQFDEDYKLSSEQILIENEMIFKSLDEMNRKLVDFDVRLINLEEEQKHKSSTSSQKDSSDHHSKGTGNSSTLLKRTIPKEEQHSTCFLCPWQKKVCSLYFDDLYDFDKKEINTNIGADSDRLTCKCRHLIRIHQHHPNSPKKPLPSFANPPWGQFLYEELIPPTIQDWIWCKYNDKQLGGIKPSLSCVLASDPNCASSRILAAALGMFSIPRPTALAHAQIVKTLGDATTSSNRYIKLHTQALIDESLNYRSRTTDTWEAILLSYPFDIMTLKFPLDTYFHIGDRNMLRDSVTRVLPIWESSSSTKIEGLPGLIFLRFIRSFKNSGIFFPRVQLIRENENNTSYRTLADYYKISIGSVSNINKRKAEYIENYEHNENSAKNRNFRDELSQQLDQKFYEWFAIQRSKNISIPGPLIQAKVREIRQQLGGANPDEFK
ncbi:unnamed protein product, partial [Rotaria magnacalcarata]